MSTLDMDVLEGSPIAEGDWLAAESVVVGAVSVEPGASLEQRQPKLSGAAMATLVGFQDEGCTPLVLFAGQIGSAAVPAASVVDVHGTHIGRTVVLLFEHDDPRRPVIVGLLRGRHASPIPGQPGQVEVEADGERLIISAEEQLVLRCGKASITLTKVGKVLIEGAYVSHKSSGVMRIKGGSVQIN